jgi:ribosomal protein S18 acetylase RimI-like enzyme
MTDTLAIRPAADDADVAHAADVIARSFDHLGANQYLIPDDARRVPIMREFFHLLTEHAVRGAGDVLLTDGAVAVWFDRTTEPGEPEGFEQRLAEAAGEHIERFHELDKLLETHRPSEPHWHLAFLAVEPGQWGQGRGSALMRHTHARLDQQGTAAYLEASNPDSQRLYRRHGYTDLDPTAIHLSDGTPFYRMWRPAQPR